MSNLAFIRGRIVTPEQVVFGSALLIREGRINGIVSENEVPSGYEPVDLSDSWLLPGFIDLHVHGGGGADVSDATVEAIRTMANFHLQGGTTSLYPTSITHERKNMLNAVKAVERAMAEEDLAGRVLGIHLEGPFLSKERKGAQNEAHILKPGIPEEDELLLSPALKLMTLAPEVEGTEEIIRFGIKRGIHFSAGHSSADYEMGLTGFNTGITQVTHLYNAMTGLDRRNPGLSAAALVSKEVKAQLICDGVHVHPAMIKLAMRTKGAEGIILITDALKGCTVEQAGFIMGDLEVEEREKAYYLVDGTLAGSKLTMIEALRNAIKFGGVALQAAAKMAALTPAQAMGIESFKGSLTPGRDADLVVLNDRLEIKQVWSMGRRCC